MRWLLPILLTATLAVQTSACGGSNAVSATHGAATGMTDAGSSTTGDGPPHGQRDRDNDNDHNDDDESVLAYGHSADVVDRRASVALVTHYFAAAAAGDGAGACSLLVPFIAEAVPENAGHTPSLRGRTCATVASKLFRQRHALFAKKHASLKILDVRVEGDKALAVLDFTAIPEVRQMIERRIGVAWRILDLVDDNIE